MNVVLTSSSEQSKTSVWKQGEAKRFEDQRELRRQRVAELRKDGATIPEIAEDVSAAWGTIHRDLQVLRQRWLDRANDSYDAHIARHIAELGAVLDNVWASESMRNSPAGMQVILSALEREAKLLGLDKPTRTESVNTSLQLSPEARAERIHTLVDRFLEARRALPAGEKKAPSSEGANEVT